MWLWIISTHLIHQTCFYYLQLCTASTSLQEQDGSGSASHIPDRTVSFISITQSWWLLRMSELSVSHSRLNQHSWGQKGAIFRLVKWAIWTEKSEKIQIWISIFFSVKSRLSEHGESPNRKLDLLIFQRYIKLSDPIVLLSCCVF